ncbi:MAG: toxin-antitoxin system YwqK family antitoxin [Bacteroidota bacterium]
MNSRFIGLLLITCICICACNDPTEHVKNYYDNGQLSEQYTRDKITYAKQGNYVKYNSQGIPIEESNYVNDTLSGRRKLYRDNGQLHIVEHYDEKGQFSGVYQAYYENGVLELEGNYVDGAMTGTWVRYYQNEQKMETVSFKDNAENGPFVEWHDNGQLKAEGEYLDGDKEHGPLLLYDRQGVLERRMSCDKGVCRTTWQRDSINTDTRSTE